MSDKPLDCQGTHGKLGKHDFKQADQTQALEQTREALQGVIGLLKHGKPEFFGEGTPQMVFARKTLTTLNSILGSE